MTLLLIGLEILLLPLVAFRRPWFMLWLALMVSRQILYLGHPTLAVRGLEVPLLGLLVATGLEAIWRLRPNRRLVASAVCCGAAGVMAIRTFRLAPEIGGLMYCRPFAEVALGVALLMLVAFSSGPIDWFAVLLAGWMLVGCLFRLWPYWGDNIEGPSSVVVWYGGRWVNALQAHLAGERWQELRAGWLTVQIAVVVGWVMVAWKARV